LTRPAIAGKLARVRARSFDEICGYALELVVGSLRGLRGALGRVLADDEPTTMRPLPASSRGERAGDRWFPGTVAAERVPDEESLRRALAASAPLSSAYADDRLVLLTRDPQTLFAYWDLAPGAEHPPGAAKARLILRIHDLTLLDFADAHPLRHQDLDVDRPVGSRYVHVERAAGTYRAEIGWRWNDGRFIARVRSGTVTTARAEAPGDDPARWLTMHRDLSRATSSRRPTGDAPAPPGAPAAPLSSTTAPPQRAPSSDELHRRGG
jgi:hypothetical protein